MCKLLTFSISILTNEIENQNSEIVALAKSIIEPDDPHKYLDDIIDGLGDEENVGLYKIIEELAKHPEWNVYTASVRNWLQNEKKQFRSIIIMSTQTSDNNKRIAKNTLLLYFRMLLIMVVTLITSRVVLYK